MKIPVKVMERSQQKVTAKNPTLQTTLQQPSKTLELACSLIEQLGDKDTTLAKVLSKLVNDFEFDRIEDWIAKTSKNNFLKS